MFPLVSSYVQLRRFLSVLGIILPKDTKVLGDDELEGCLLQEGLLIPALHHLIPDSFHFNSHLPPSD